MSLHDAIESTCARLAEGREFAIKEDAYIFFPDTRAFITASRGPGWNILEPYDDGEDMVIVATGLPLAIAFTRLLGMGRI